jgi:hypothetical protein
VGAAYSLAASEVNEFVFEDADDRRREARHQGVPHRLRERSQGARALVAAALDPRQAGQGHDRRGGVPRRSAGLIKAAMAMLIWGGSVAIISSHNGEDNAFNELVRDIRAGKLPYALHRTRFARRSPTGSTSGSA